MYDVQRKRTENIVFPFGRRGGKLSERRTRRTCVCTEKIYLRYFMSEMRLVF